MFDFSKTPDLVIAGFGLGAAYLTWRSQLAAKKEDEEEDVELAGSPNEFVRFWESRYLQAVREKDAACLARDEVKMQAFEEVMICLDIISRLARIQGAAQTDYQRSQQEEILTIIRSRHFASKHDVILELETIFASTPHIIEIAEEP